MVRYILFTSELLAFNCIYSIHNLMQKFLCMPGNVLSERNAVVKTLTLTTGRNGKKKQGGFPNIRHPENWKKQICPFWERGRSKKGKRHIGWKVNTVWDHHPELSQKQGTRLRFTWLLPQQKSTFHILDNSSFFLNDEKNLVAFTV